MTEQGPTVFGGRYELHRHIARGGMADVYLARDQLLDRWVAVKVLFAEFATDPTFVERFRREAQAAAKLNHPNIVAIYDWGEEEGTYFIVMEYIEGLSLSQILKQEGKMSAERAADIAIEVASGLGYAHQKGYVHLDAKSANVLLSRKGEIKLGDFGIAKAIAGSVESSLTQTGAVMGTATYFSPEQAQGRQVGPQSDLYSLGVVLYEMLVGRPPFTGDTPVSIAYKHVQEPPPAPSEFGVDVPSPLAAITRKLLAKNPENRYLTAEDLVSDLRRFRAGEQINHPAEPNPTTVTPPIYGPGGNEPPVPVTVTPAPAPVGPVPVGATTAMPIPVTSDPTQAAPAYYAPPPADRRSVGAVVMAFIFGTALLAAIGIIAFLAMRTDEGDDITTTEVVDVPAVFGLNQDDARRQLEDLGLVVNITPQTNPERAAGTVLGQEPSADAKVDRGTVIELTVSSGIEKVLVPTVIDIQQAGGETTLREAGFRVIIESVTSETQPEGQIIEQFPRGGEFVPPGSEITLTVSIGPPDVLIPDVVNQTQEVATARLEREGFVVVAGGTFSDEIEQGLVAGTSPTANTQWTKGATVEILLSRGPELLMMPDLRTTNPEDAKLVLAGEPFGFNLPPTEEFVDVEDPALEGVVVEQNPAPGTELNRDAQIAISIGRLVLATPVPIATVPPTPVPAQPTVTPIPAQPTAVPTSPPAPTVTPVPTTPAAQTTCTDDAGNVFIDDPATATCP